MRQKWRRGASRKTARVFRAGAALLAVILCFSFLDWRLRPVITTMAQYECRVVSVLAMNEAVMQELQQDPALTKDLVQVQRAQDGSVRSVQVDAAKLNRLKADLTEAVAKRLQLLKKEDVSIPLGTLLGWQLLAGRGPDIHLQLVPTSFVQADSNGQLATAGINQTQHRVLLHLTVNMSAILPGYSTSIKVEDEVCVAETLIVGEVPQFYAVT